MQCQIVWSTTTYSMELSKWWQNFNIFMNYSYKPWGQRSLTWENPIIGNTALSQTHEVITAATFYSSTALCYSIYLFICYLSFRYLTCNFRKYRTWTELHRLKEESLTPSSLSKRSDHVKHRSLTSSKLFSRQKWIRSFHRINPRNRKTPTSDYFLFSYMYDLL